MWAEIEDDLITAILLLRRLTSNRRDEPETHDQMIIRANVEHLDWATILAGLVVAAAIRRGQTPES
jgi:hypothetical protein